MNAIDVFIGVLVAGAAGFVAFRLVAAVLRLRGTRLVTCPENEKPAAVDLDLRYVVWTSALGGPHFRLKECSRWPEKAGCGQMCLGQLEGAPQDCLVTRVLGAWYQGQTCVYCRRPFQEIHWHDNKPALRGPDHVIRDWADVPAETVPEVLRTAAPVCFNCAAAERFREQHPDLVVDRPRRNAPPAA